MNLIEMVEDSLTEATKLGHKKLADRLSKDTGKKISASAVSNYLKKLDRKKTIAAIKRNAMKAKDSGAYKWGTIYKILLNHFKV